MLKQDLKGLCHAVSMRTRFFQLLQKPETCKLFWSTWCMVRDNRDL